MVSMAMDDHKLRVFCTVAETKSFSKASEIIHLTQPAVSLQIQALEELYETKLFDRSSSTVTLTPAGELLYKYAKHILSLYSSAEKEVGELTGLVKGSISVGASTTIGNYLLPQVICDFRKKRAKVKINLRVGNTKMIVDLLNAGNIDIGLVEGDVSRQKIAVEKLIDDELCLVLPPQHPWARKKEISLFEIIKEPFILREEGSGTRQVIEKYFSKHGVSTQNMKITLILGSTESIKHTVANGMGMSILSRWAAISEVKFGVLKLISLKEEKMMRQFSLISTKYTVLSHPADDFLSYLKNYKYDSVLHH
ncbi:HTH-type transcriptional regulator CysL [bacterium BMS3Bbin06]|nr:HTH-type transcriptional regulator CysL [bacterium BMS3Abin08]GBE33992.1 HTH-type transcriptional regulator CysL [bacterium BMS3Bbin06]